ncbi:DMT family transporter, partial [Paenibacillus sp. 28ISP30-2]|nr:DMT family transporter [Paenibacillus sp. 28ISP30-2]
TRKQWMLIIWSGIALGLHFLLWMGSLRLTTVASSTVIMTLEPILVMLGSFLFFRTGTNRAMLIGMGLAFVGSLAIGAGDFHASGQALLGDALSFLGMVAVSIHMLMGKHLREHLSAFVYNLWVFAIAATSLALYNVINTIPFTGYAPREWGLFLLLAIVPTLFGHYLFNWLLKYINATAVSMAVLGEPVISSLLAWVLLGEKLSALQFGAGFFILFGVWIFIRYGTDFKKQVVHQSELPASELPLKTGS